MAGIYIHIPFCRRKCHYCNFFSLASQKLKEPFLRSLKKEMELTRNYLSGEEVNTIYFGGGTPSVYGPGMLQEVVDMVDASPPDPSAGKNASPPDPSARGNASPPDPSPRGEGRKVVPGKREITLELNPEDVTEGFVAELRGTSFNRFSLGVQSFSDADLLFLNRSHSADQALRAVRLLQEAGYENISIDLIYGIPSADNDQWMHNLDIAFSLGVPHISAYALTVEPKTPLAWMIEKHKTAPVKDESQVAQFNLLMKKSKELGFLQYEISNYCKPGMHAIHNTNYWNGVPYLGLGPSAHSYNGTSRRWNVSNLSKYMEGIEKNECIYEEEILTNTQKYNEYVMTSLRTMWGCDLGKINDELRMTNDELGRKRAASFIQQGWLTEHAGVFFLTDEGKLFADRIAAELFLPEQD